MSCGNQKDNRLRKRDWSSVKAPISLFFKKGE